MESIETVGDLVKVLLTHDQAAPVRGCAEWPFFRSIEAVEVPPRNHTDYCVAIRL